MRIVWLFSAGVLASAACSLDDAVVKTMAGGGAGAAGTRVQGASSSTTAGSSVTTVAAAGTGGSSAGGNGGANVGGAGMGDADASMGGAGMGGSDIGGNGGAGGAGGVVVPPSICDGVATRILTNSKTDAKVEDFEAAAISARWSWFSDVMPVPNSFRLVQVTTDGAATTTRSGRYQGTGARNLAAGGYGLGIVYNVAIDTLRGVYCVDISAFDGVSFWAKAGTDGAQVEVNFVIPETNATQDHGDCTIGCFNHPRAPVTLTTTWTQYTVAFTDITMGAAAVKNRIQELGWLSPDATDWDFSIDEIAFYKGTPPIGPVGVTDQ